MADPVMAAEALPADVDNTAAAQPANEQRTTPAALPVVVSTNLCADLLLLRLGAPGQIRSVSYQAQNPAQSPVAELARQYPANRGAVEELLYFDPEIALTYLGWSGRPHAELLAEQGIRVITLPYPRTIEDAFSMTTEIAQAIGRSAAGQRAVTLARARIQALSDAAATWDRAPRVLYLRPNGGTAGSDTYVDAMLRLLDLRNLATDKGIRGWGTLPLEQLIADPPDLFLLGYFDQAQPLSKSRYGRHPLLGKLLAQVPSIQLPSSTAWGCGGLELIDAAAQIAEQLAALELNPQRPLEAPAPAPDQTRPRLELQPKLGPLSQATQVTQ
ncbi:ABC transporter substrate-binding protein [Halochromatium sp.]